MKLGYLLTGMGVMALVTYLVRVLPIFLIRGKIKNRFLNDFLYYVPFAVLAAMTVPDVFFATGHLWSAVAAMGVAVLLAFLDRSMIVVALAASGAALIIELLFLFL